jgi:hypothetical protein
MGKTSLAVLFLSLLIPAARGQNFSGTWRLASDRPETGSLPEAPAAELRIDHHGVTLRCVSGGAEWSFTTDGRESRSMAGGKSLNTIAKWEGPALLINTIVNGATRNYTQMDRWTVSQDGTTLTISREIVGRTRDVEATLVYRREGAPEAAPRTAQLARPAPPQPDEYPVDAGTRIPLVLLNSVSSKQSAEGDRIYLRTAFPVLSRGEVAIPPGSYVAGTLTFVKRPGRVKGRGELYLRFDSLTLPNGVTRDFRARIGGLDAETPGELDRREGGIRSEGHRAGDAGTVVRTTTAGASIGGIAGAAAGRPGPGVGIGAAAGAAAGLAGTLLSRGPDVVLAQGATVEMVLDRRLVFTADEIAPVLRRAR